MQHRMGINGYRVILSFALALLFIGILPIRVWAHATAAGYSDIKVESNALQYHLSFPESDLIKILPVDKDGDGKLSDEELSDSADEIAGVVDDNLIVTGDGKLASGTITAAKHEKRASLDMIGIDVAYSFPSSVGTFLVQYNFFWYSGIDPNHSNFATIDVGGQTIQQVLGSQNYIIQIHGPSAASKSNKDHGNDHASSGWAETLWNYTVMGMKHIWSGLDHMLFVVGLLLASNRNTRHIIALISAFTVGHCITLVLSSLEIAYLSPKIVEPLIALSILYIAVENIWRKQESRRIVVTLLFGLVHGFGFAEVLRGTLSGNMALPLFSFNLGVEIGQLVVVAICIPLLSAISRIPTKIQWTHFASGIIGCFGLYWFFERILA